MKTMLIYTETFINDEINEETGELITPAHYDKNLVTFELSDVVKVRVDWQNLVVMTVDGKITEIKNVVDIYYR